MAWIVGVAVFLVVTGGSVPAEAPKDVKVTDLVGKWKRADVKIDDALELKMSGSCERIFAGKVMKGQWMRTTDGTILIGFPDPTTDRNPLRVRGCKDGRMETVSKSGLLERWTR
jgi:hypothetical protein